MTEHYPGYDVLAKQDSESWDDITREVIRKRLDVPREPRYFTEEEFRTLNAIAARVIPQPDTRPAVPIAAYVDAKIADRHEDGYRYAQLPEQGEAWKRGLDALDAESRNAHAVPFHDLTGAQQDALLHRMQSGDLHSEAWRGMPPKLFFAHRLIADITHVYYAHPTGWSEIGFGGPASPRGYVRTAINRKDPWEPAEAKPGEEQRAREENLRVR